MTHGAFEPLVGVDLYGDAGRLRSDDLFVRDRVAGLLAQAAQTLSAAAAEYRRLHVPQPTREQPFPPPELLVPAEAARRCADRYTAAADRVRNAPFPPDPKKAWKKLRGSGAARLLELDRGLIGQAEFAAAVVSGVTADTLGDLPDQEAARALAEVASILELRGAHLNAL
jgi:hypothetical protein